ncbi:MAG: GMC family oxidoreductase [Polyangiaceae bacterium]|nr:GMC family oxidoreductase [Polyangiaceae bacterium]
MSGSIVDLSQEAAPDELSVEVCVVGSGSGGATAAWELARAGREVLVIEEGGDYTGPQLTGRDGAMYDQLYMDRGGRATSDMSISVLQGRALGGGGVINACDVVPIPDGVLRHWQERHGLADYGPEAVAPFRAAALEDLSASPPRGDQINANNAALLEGARALGFRHEIMLHNRVGCAGAGTCLLGCPANAKKNPRFVAIPRAIEAGARFFVRARVVRVEGASAERKRLTVRALDPRGYHERREFTITARIVVLAANAIASAELLLRSGIGNEHVGRHLMLQPQLPVTALFDREIRFYRGIPQSAAITEFEELDNPEHGLWGFRVESIGGTPGIVASLLPVLGLPGKELMRRYPNMAAALLLVPDAPNGSVRVGPNGRLFIDYVMPEEQERRYRQAARAAARAFLAAGATTVHVPCARPALVRSERDLAALDALEFLPATTPFISAHQQGTVRFAPSPRDGGASPDGQVYGTRDVYVFDSSGFPSSASSHTMAPIMTISRMLSRRLAARG